MEDLDGETQGNFIEDPMLYKTTHHSAVNLYCAPKERFVSGTISLTNTKHLQSNAISLHNQKPSMS